MILFLFVRLTCQLHACLMSLTSMILLDAVFLPSSLLLHDAEPLRPSGWFGWLAG